MEQWHSSSQTAAFHGQKLNTPGLTVKYFIVNFVQVICIQINEVGKLYF